MKIEYGCQPNCSETVIRLFQVDYDSLPPDVKSNTWGFDEPTAGYSSMMPLPGTKCVYYYQTTGHELQEWLEQQKIPYDIEAPFQEQHPDWDLLEPTEEEKQSERDGGGGSFYRRKPYDN
jgi:hypothetical protein